MTQHVLLNKDHHRNLRVRTDRSAELGDNMMFAVTFVEELRTIQAHYPVFFQKDTEGQFQCIALMGFEQGENLFLTEQGWDAHHIPILVERLPFLIGLQQQNGNQDRVIHIDLDNPRVNETEGEALFDQLGSPTEYLQRVSALLEATHQGLEENKTFIAMLNELDLLESFSLDVELDNGSQHQLLGFYTINEDKLEKLSAPQLSMLHEKGYLQAVYMILASHSHLRDLIARKNQRVSQA
ncbi:SapC family protein [Lacimicrobium sp. SS2-24]|uniref:SapC family protein n=1 Tax=Lacimicrobium sp. SS2-24 TaxID=2005569 RepID=UPI000B4BFF5B|nr:SapC family protein [Lacimicrobium sp. SS2-24]